MGKLYDIGNHENEELNWKITFREDAFEFHKASTGLGSMKCELTEDVRQMESEVEILDRYDRFDKRLIPDSAYARVMYKSDDGKLVEYGITYSPEIHGPEVIENGKPFQPVVMRHQKISTEKFLKNHRGFGMLADVVGSGKTYESGIVLSELATRGIVTSVLLVVPDVVFESWIKVMEHDFGLGKIEKGGPYDDPCRWEKSDGKFVKNNAVAKDTAPVVLHPIGRELKNEDFEFRDGYLQPKYPMIVKSSDFIKWRADDLKDKLFAVVVVDEAHRLCDENEAQNKKAMYLLSLIMATKRKAKLTYCLMLSATPHAGNLEDMFRLWYFIRLQGGEPRDFLDGTTPTQHYLDEKEYYLNDICHGAKTVLDFVIKEEIGILRGGRALFMKSLHEWLEQKVDFGTLLNKHMRLKIAGDNDVEYYINAINNAADEERKAQLRHDFADIIMTTSVLRKTALEAFFELQENKKNHLASYKTPLMIYMYRFWQDSEDPTLARHRNSFDAYLSAQKLDKTFDYLHEGGKYKIIDEFFKNDRDAAVIKEYVTKRVAYAYHYRILHTIMERQPRAMVKKVSKKKSVVNFLFVNSDMDVSNPRQIDLKLLDKDVTLNYDPQKLDFLNDPKAIYNKRLQKYYTLEEFVSTREGNYGDNYKRALLDQILPKLGFDNNDHADLSKPNAFRKQRSLTFYQEQISHIRRSSSDDEVRYSFVPVKAGVANAVYNAKIAKLKQIISEHDSERVIVFFDYSIDDEKRMEDPLKGYTIKDVYRSLKETFADRLLDLADEENRKDVKEKFDDDHNGDAVLVASDYKFTEGANFQKCCVIVNFEVTPNPIGIQQSIGRVFRYGQKNDVTIYSLADICDLEGYVLAYFTRIDLMSDKNGEAEILAGCNNDNMVTIRCPRCGRMLYMSMEDYEALKEDKSSEVYCGCDGARPILMTPIGAQEYACDNTGGDDPCKAHIYKRGDQYTCYGYGHSDLGVLETEAGTNEYHCPKLCLMKHCSRFSTGDLKGKCAVMNALENHANMSEVQLQALCIKCKQRKLGACPEECWLTSDSSCCSNKRCSNGAYVSCQYAPQSIKFNENMEAPCPYCGHGTLRPIKSKTFENFIREAFKQKIKKLEDDRFVENFRTEINKVVQVYEILNSDNIMDEKDK